ncbi:hypothetical protein PPACK8108_LOCUS19136 [Phakopsora pachyrhizi]|uniref:Uncharacterized protein n=1 Tax=Phakopsora pachyrhizi TaxID=170000 RepID=A0AAV0BDU1_PHAPC|nr:hypothetical protein PPACK8108_LOCUS19136 [Phakopsora pachyrhizi]
MYNDCTRQPLDNHVPVNLHVMQAEDWLSRTEGDEAAEERRVVVIVLSESRRIRCTKMLLLVIPPELSQTNSTKQLGTLFSNPIELGDRVDWLALGLKTPVTIDESRLLVLVVLMVVRLGPGLRGR